MKYLRKHILIISLVFMLTVATVASAFAPIVFVAGWLLEMGVGATGFLVSDLVVGQAGLIAGALWYDCNKFSTSGVCTNKPATMPASEAPGAYITVKLGPEDARENPDSEKFDDVVPPARDVTPKQQVPGASGGPLPAGTVSYTPTGQPAQTASGGIFSCPGSYCSDAQNVYIFRNCAPANPYTTYCEFWMHSYTQSGDDLGEWMANQWFAFSTAGVTFGTVSESCPPGYSAGAGGCALTNAQDVKKPSTTPCEILWMPSTGVLSSDSKNPNCDGIENGSSISVTSQDGSGMSISPNDEGGFDITKSNGNGTSVTARTGPYDGVGKGYPIVGTAGSAGTGAGGQNGMGGGCGVEGKPVCSIAMLSDSETEGVGGSNRDSLTTATDGIKAMVDGIDPNKFNWTFIPDIPVAQCVNPHVKNPVLSQYIDMDICESFNRFSFFLNAVIAALCLYGCVHQIQSAMKGPNVRSKRKRK